MWYYGQWIQLISKESFFKPERFLQFFFGLFFLYETFSRYFKRHANKNDLLINWHCIPVYFCKSKSSVQKLKWQFNMHVSWNGCWSWNKKKKTSDAMHCFVVDYTYFSHVKTSLILIQCFPHFRTLNCNVWNFSIVTMIDLVFFLLGVIRAFVSSIFLCVIRRREILL